MREADVAIRLQPPSQADLIQRKLFSIRIHFYATLFGKGSDNFFWLRPLINSRERGYSPLLRFPLIIGNVPNRTLCIPIFPYGKWVYGEWEKAEGIIFAAAH